MSGIRVYSRRPALERHNRGQHSSTNGEMSRAFAGIAGGLAQMHSRGPASHLLKAVRGQVVTLVHDEVAVIRDRIVDGSLADQALNQRHVDRACALLASASDVSD